MRLTQCQSLVTGLGSSMKSLGTQERTECLEIERLAFWNGMSGMVVVLLLTSLGAGVKLMMIVQAPGKKLGCTLRYGRIELAVISRVLAG